MRPIPQCLASILPLVAALAGLAAATWSMPVRAQGTGVESARVAVASGTGPLTTEITVESFVEGPAERGQQDRRFVPARKVAAGEEVHYTIRVRNPGKVPVRDVVVTKRLPFGVNYIPASAVGPASSVEVSTDGGHAFARPARQHSEPTHLRWILHRPLAPGATALLRFRATFR